MKIIFFIDGYPYYLIDKIKSYNLFKSYSVMKPSYGYSVNLHYELFQGIGPDKLGFFGDIAFINNGYEEPSLFMKYWDNFRFKYPFFMRIIYKLLNKFLKKDFAFMPVSIVNNFTKKGKYLLQENEYLIIGDNKYKIYCYDKKSKFGTRDELVFKEALYDITHGKQQNLLIAFTELDWISHKFGVDSNEFNNKIVECINYMQKIKEITLQIDKNAEFVLVSDHGMVNTQKGINLNLEKKFGMPGKDGVYYFYDSLYLHLWDIKHHNNKYKELKEFLLSLNIGNFITKEERKIYKIDSNLFGDDIFVLNEGLAFAPNYFGYGLLQAYHGYRPDCFQNKGIFCSTKHHDKDEYSTYEIFDFLCKDF